MHVLRKTTLTAALVVAIGMGTSTYANTITWNVDGNGDWSDVNNWNPIGSPAGEDVLLGGINTASRTLNLDGDWTINSLEIQSDNRYILNGGSLILTTGNLTIGQTLAGPTPTGYAQHQLNVPIQIGDGVTAVNNAVWDVHSASGVSAASTTNMQIITEVRGISGSHIELTGNGSLKFTGSSNNYFGDWTLNHNEDSENRKIQLDADNALGMGTVTVQRQINLHLSHQVTSTTHAMDIVFDSPDKSSIFIGTFNAPEPGDYTATFQGDMGGTSDLQLGRTDSPYLSSSGFKGTLILEGANNTHSGNIELRAGAGIQIDGVWTGAGNITASVGNSTGRVAGSGTLGMANGSVLDIDHGSLAPGTDGTVGTFTVGTVGNNNVVTFNSNGTLLIDIDGNAADQLIILGDLDLANASDVIAFSEISTPTAGFYTLVTYTGNLSGEFSSVVGLPDGYELDYSVQGQINLIPEPASLAMLGLGGLMILSRRRRNG